MTGAPIEALQRVPLFAELNRSEVKRIAAVFRERHFAAGETVVQQGSGGAAFYVIDSGEARVFVGGEERATLGAGDHFGELALIDEGTRTATITASSELVCYGVTFWDFRPLVESSGVIGWKLLQSLVRMYRAAQDA
ncbi:MAG: cyclic nucleotide-binding domain-containing protein [Solirubrobacteraceae bacterium]|jgi:CRP-like cAMP-binding protein